MKRNYTYLAASLGYIFTLIGLIMLALITLKSCIDMERLDREELQRMQQNLGLLQKVNYGNIAVGDLQQTSYQELATRNDIFKVARKLANIKPRDLHYEKVQDTQIHAR